MLNGWNVVLPIPANWQDFENIVTEALKIRYSNPNFTKNGRLGQKQNGVDIYAQSESNVIAAQCKLTFDTIDEKVILAEIQNAKNFDPHITIFHICTTSPRDAKLQQFIREQQISAGFLCDILFWDDIVHLVWLDPVIFKNIFGAISSMNLFEEHDINMINALFSLVNVLLIQRTLEIDLPMRMPDEFVYFFEDFHNQWTLCTSFFHDQTLQTLVDDFHDCWNKIIIKTSNAFFLVRMDTHFLCQEMYFNHKIKKIIIMKLMGYDYQCIRL